jgi:hypothetical protein
MIILNEKNKLNNTIFKTSKQYSVIIKTLKI